MPSKVTDVPGSQGPKQSGSVIVPTEVPTQTSTMSFGSHLCRLAGGGLLPVLPLSSTIPAAELCSPVSVLLPEDDAELPAGVDNRFDTAELPEESALSKLEGTDVDCSWDFSTLLDEEEEPLPMLVLLPLLFPLPVPLLPLPEEFECCCWFDSFALSFEDGGPGAFGVLLLLLNEGPVLVFDANKLVEVLVLVLF